MLVIFLLITQLAFSISETCQIPVSGAKACKGGFKCPVEYDDKRCSKQFGCWNAGNWNILPVLQLTHGQNGRKNLNNTCIAECLDHLCIKEISQALTERKSQESVKKIPKGRPDPKLYIFFNICYLVFC